MSTHAEFFEIAVGETLAVASAANRTDITEETLRAGGTTWNLVLNTAASLAAEISYQQAIRNQGLALDVAFREALSRLVNDRYGISRQGATASVGEVTLTRTDTTSSLPVPAGTVLRATLPDGSIVKFTTDFALEFVAGASSPESQTVQVTSTQAGRSQNVAAGLVTEFEAGPPQSDMTATNAARIAGGNEVETDEQLKARARSFFINARRATLQAIVQGALSIDQVREAAAFEELDTLGRPTGVVTLIVADEEGTSNATLVASVDTVMEEWRGAGIYVQVVGATVVYRDIIVAIVWKAGQATAANKVAVARSIVARVNALDPNGAATAADAPAAALLTPGLIETAARAVAGVVGVTVVTPTGTEAPAHGEIIRTSLGRVKVQ